MNVFCCSCGARWTIRDDHGGERFAHMREHAQRAEPEHFWIESFDSKEVA